MVIMRVSASVIDSKLAAYLGQDVVNVSYDLPSGLPCHSEGYVSVRFRDVKYKWVDTGRCSIAPAGIVFRWEESRDLFYLPVRLDQDQVKEDILQYLLYDIAN